MSVFTSVERAELERFLHAYEVGTLEYHAGIEAGIENTNYFVTTTAGRFVLTLFEQTPAAALDYFLDLMAFLAAADIPCATPVAARDGRLLATLKGKPAALVTRLAGHGLEQRPSRGQCAAIGAALARMHVAVAGFARQRPNDRGPAWRAQVIALLRDHVDVEERALFDTVLACDREVDWSSALPSGVIHADLFRDNALFEGEHLAGIIDFYYAHNGPFVYDLAVCVSDWCFHGGDFDRPRAQALLAAYQRHRPLTIGEREAWVAALRTAGARFWLSRLKDRIFPRRGTLTHCKDPAPFRHVLERALRQPAQLAAMWPVTER